MGNLRNFYIGMRNKWPYTDFHELNADWMIVIIEQLIDEVENFVAQNALKYADPIQWDITSQYEKNTAVVDPVTGTAYLSARPVPKGIALSNSYYWSVVFDLGRFITLASQNFAVSYEAVPTTTATVNTNAGKWLVWNSILYQARNDIHIGDAYVIDANIKKKTVEEFFDDLAADLTAETQARIDADNAEAQTRADDDARIELELSDLIASEVQHRIDEDARIELELSDLIASKVNIEAQARADEDVRIELELSDLIASKVNIEAQARADEDDRIENFFNGEIGNLANLTTENRDNIVKAINEVNSKAAGAYDKADIRNYGGVADGVTDNTQAFIDCMADNNVVYLPHYNASSYYFTSKIILSGTGQGVIGDEGTVVSAPNVTDLFEIRGSFITIKNLIISTVSNIFYLNSLSAQVRFINIENIVAQNANMFMHDNSAATNRITNLYLDKCYSFANVSYGIYMTKAFAFIFLNNVTIIEIGTTATQACFNFENCEGLHMTHCEAEGGLTDGSHIGHIGFRFLNCQAIWLERCMADSLDSHAFVFQDTNYVYMTACTAALCCGHGIAILGTTSRNYMVTNCYIQGRRPYSPAPAGAHGIYNYNNLVTISNCTILNMTGHAIANNSQGNNTIYNGINVNTCQSSFYSSAGVGIVTNLISAISGDSPTFGAFNHTDNLINGVFG